jgi:predicted branched-subunit amino acid permease
MSAAREALGLPALVLGASYVGFGSLVREADLGLWFGLYSTAAGWALPGQIVVVELYGIGSSVLMTSVAVALTNARLLPMAVTLVPILRNEGQTRWKYFVAAHFIAVTGWATALIRCPGLPREHRLTWFAFFSGVLWIVSMAGTAIGFLLAGAVPQPVTLGLVFLNPLYFMLVFAADLKQRTKVYALCAGAALGPLLHLIEPDWGLLATGLVAGTGAYLAGRGLSGRGGRRLG